MSFKRRLLIILTFLFATSAIAQTDLTGTWQGQLVTAPGAEMTVQFIINTDSSGAYSALINSPDNGALKNMPADSITVTGADIVLEFTALSGGFNGAMINGELTGQWQQLNDSFPLVLTPYQEAQMSAADLEYILGSWVGKIITPAIEVPIVYLFELDENGELVGSFDSPIEGAFGLPISDITFADSKLSLSLEFAGVRYEGEVGGEGIEGNWLQGGQELPVNIVKGEYESVEIELDLDEASQETLLGIWSGELTTPLGAITLKFRFEKDDAEKFVAYVDSPTQGVDGLVITEISLEDATLSFSLSVPPAQYSGELEGDEIVGAWVQNGASTSLTVTKE